MSKMWYVRGCPDRSGETVERWEGLTEQQAREVWSQMKDKQYWYIFFAPMT